MLDEVLFVVIESLPVLYISCEVDFFSCPEGSHLVLVHLPDIVVLDGKNDKSVGVLFKERLRKRSLSLGEVTVLRCKIVIVSIGRVHL